MSFDVDFPDEPELLGSMTGRMREKVLASMDAADHLEDTDLASCELALQLADIIDHARDTEDHEAMSKASFGTIPTLHKVLTSLGLNPEGRQKLGLDDGPEDAEDF